VKQAWDNVRAVSMQNTSRTGSLDSIPLISIVDDDASARIATGRLVRALGFRAFAFASADEFLSSPQLHETACLVSDVQMPRIGGLELQARLRAAGTRIPIIFMTAFPHEEIREHALAAGAICVLAKPLDAATLSRCIDTALRGDAIGRR
jgi:FixJ family two-component response regulator